MACLSNYLFTVFVKWNIKEKKKKKIQYLPPSTLSSICQKGLFILDFVTTSKALQAVSPQGQLAGGLDWWQALHGPRLLPGYTYLHPFHN